MGHFFQESRAWAAKQRSQPTWRPASSSHQRIAMHQAAARTPQQARRPMPAGTACSTRCASRQQKNPPCESTCGYCGALQALKLLNWCAGGDPKHGLNPHKITATLRTLQKIPAKIPTLFKVPYICFNPVDVLSYPPIADLHSNQRSRERGSSKMLSFLTVTFLCRPPGHRRGRLANDRFHVSN